jgi:hypothetical protein
MRCPLRPDVHDARGRFLWQSAGFFRAKTAGNGMTAMRAGRGVSCRMVPIECGMEFGKMGDRILPNGCQKTASGTPADCNCHISRRRQNAVPDKVPRSVSRRNSLQNRENCGLAATRTFENS